MPTTTATRSTAYDVEYPLQIHGFDPNFHFVGMTFNPEGFADMKDKYFLLNGRSYPGHGLFRNVEAHFRAMQTQTADGASHFSQPLSANINIPGGRKSAAAHLRPRRQRVPDAGFAGHSDARHRIQRQAAPRPGRQQHGLLHQLHHPRRRRVTGRDPGRDRITRPSRRSTCTRPIWTTWPTMQRTLAA